MKRNILKSRTDSVGLYIIGTILIGTFVSVFAFYPISLYTNPYVYPNPESYISNDNLELKRIYNMRIIESPKLGFNTLEVSWPIWSDCSPVSIEIVQYNMFRQEIYIWIWGYIAVCPQVAALEDHKIEVFIPFSGSWKIFCNNYSITIFL